MATQEGLIRNIGIMQNGEIDIFLGAGASIGSGIPTGQEMVWYFKRRLYCTENKISEEKFKDVKSLEEAYINLQSEFTRKCQKLSELEMSKLFPHM